MIRQRFFGSSIQKMGLSQVENLCCCPIQQKQKSRGVITASLDFFVRIAQAVHNLLMLCDSPFAHIVLIFEITARVFRFTIMRVFFCRVIYVLVVSYDVLVIILRNNKKIPSDFW